MRQFATSAAAAAYADEGRADASCTIVGDARHG